MQRSRAHKHGGYFMFSRAGVPIAGAMGDMGTGQAPNNTWKTFFETKDIDRNPQTRHCPRRRGSSPSHGDR